MNKIFFIHIISHLVPPPHLAPSTLQIKDPFVSIM